MSQHIFRDLAIRCGAIVCLALAPLSPATAEAERSLDERCRAEVVELHQFLEAWSNAELPANEEAFSRFGAVIAPGFSIVDPDGSVVERPPIVDAIRAAHGRWKARPGRIRIENFRLRHAAGGLALATYEEWHELPGGTTGRVSTVLFGANPSTPNSVEWLHLHEVWMPAAASASGNG
jgi:hypothetical protein